MRADQDLIMRKLTVEQCEVISASGPAPPKARPEFVTTPMPGGGKRQCNRLLGIAPGAMAIQAAP